MITAGIDAGSRAIKVVLFDAQARELIVHQVLDQGVDQARLAEDLFAEALKSAGLDHTRVSAIVATGYGRNQILCAQTTITEITCHAAGVHHWGPAARSIIEIGGQDSKFIRLDPGGRVRDFAMNDRCAAGTGRFLEVIATRLNLDLATLDNLGRKSQCPAQISNTCVVFAETEIIGLLAQGHPLPDIVAGVQSAMATRVAAMAGSAWEQPIWFTGGVALQPGMVQALSQTLGSPLQVSPLPQFTGALGAAILAAKRMK